MSSASGIRVSPDVIEAWTNACKPEVADVRALVLHIEQGGFYEAGCQSSSMC